MNKNAIFNNFELKAIQSSTQAKIIKIDENKQYEGINMVGVLYSLGDLNIYNKIAVNLSAQDKATKFAKKLKSKIQELKIIKDKKYQDKEFYRIYNYIAIKIIRADIKATKVFGCDAKHKYKRQLQKHIKNYIDKNENATFKEVCINCEKEFKLEENENK